MYETLVAKSKLRRTIALDAVAAARGGSTPNVVHFGATHAVRFACVRDRALNMESAMLLAEPNELLRGAV